MSFRLLLIISFVLIIIIEFYFFKKVLNSIKNSFPKIDRKKLKTWSNILFLFFNLYPLYLLGALIYSYVFNNEWPGIPESSLFDYFILYPFWIFILLVVQSTLFFWIIEILKLLLLPFYRKKKEKFKSLEAKAVLIIAVIFAIYVPARVLYDYNSISIRIVEFKKQNLPKELNNFKITFISDLQADKYTDEKRLGNFISKVNSTNPDLVLVGGDIITSTPNYIDMGAKFLGMIKSKFGIYSCIGDHDNWAYRPDYEKSRQAVTSALKKYGVTMVDNGRKVVHVDKSTIGITFVTDTYSKKINNGTLDTLIENHRYDLNIFLVHQPRPNLVEVAKKNNYDLFLSGHTHGGQVTFLFPFKNLTPTLIETKYVRGNFYFNNMLMIVTRGLGMSLVPLRYNSTPEVTVIVLKNK